mgnify:CR=1 FL=1
MKRPLPFAPALAERRLVLKSAAAAVTALLGPATGTSRAATGTALGFTAVPASLQDAVRVPPGYEFQVLYRWGDPTGIATQLPPFKPDASNTAAVDERTAPEVPKGPEIERTA